jgi:hypothetical protein
MLGLTPFLGDGQNGVFETADVGQSRAAFHRLPVALLSLNRFRPRDFHVSTRPSANKRPKTGPARPGGSASPFA